MRTRERARRAAPTLTPMRLPLGALLAVGLLSGCSAATPGPAAGAGAGPSPVPLPSAATAQAPTACPGADRPATPWPGAVPADLPQPPSAQVTGVDERDDGLTVVRFTTATSIRESVVFLVEALPAAGYTLARGDAENTEADAPFVKDGLRGVMRMIAVEECRTDWLMALTRGAPGGTPLLPVRPSASPLPFG